jgi:hypothetical protein
MHYRPRSKTQNYRTPKGKLRDIRSGNVFLAVTPEAKVDKGAISNYKLLCRKTQSTERKDHLWNAAQHSKITCLVGTAISRIHELLQLSNKNTK